MVTLREELPEKLPYLPDYHLKGGCYALALALNKAFGWPIYALMTEEEKTHAVVCLPDGRYLDARGFVPEERVGSPFGLQPPYQLVEVPPAELRREDESDTMREDAISRARRAAEWYWRALPWPDSFAERASAFCESLGLLCAELGINFIMPPGGIALRDCEAGDGTFQVSRDKCPPLWTLTKTYP